jgi:hypothetical protein
MIENFTVETTTIGKINSRDYKIKSPICETNVFTLKSGLNIYLVLSSARDSFEVAIGEMGLTASSTYRSKKPMTIRDFMSAAHNAMKNFKKAQASETSQTWVKYKNPNLLS